MIAVGQLILIIIGLLMLTRGANWLVDGAVYIAAYFGVNELVIGLTIVAGGTSLPELAASIVAVIRKQRDLAVGNIVGSNMFNLLTILGVTGAAQRTMQVNTQIIYLDMPVMIAATLIVLPLAFTRWKITRVEGAILFLLYITYMVALIAGWLTF